MSHYTNYESSLFYPIMSNKTNVYFSFDRETMSNPSLDFMTKVESRFQNRLDLLNRQCALISGKPRNETISENLNETNWYTKTYTHFTDFISTNPPVFGCAALKASSGQMRVLSMFWKGKDLNEGSR